MPSGYMIPREVLINELRRISNILIKIPTMQDFDKYSKVGRAVTCAKKFGGWKNFLIAAGFEPNAARRSYSNDELKEEFIRIAHMLGHTPTMREYDEYCKVGKSGSVARRFGDGKWDNACNTIGYIPSKRPPPPIKGGWNKGKLCADVNLDELKYLYEIEGLSIESIANKLGVGRGTIRRRMDLAGIDVKRHHYTQPRQTLPETILYKELERQRIPFMKQQPIDGLYVVDVLVPGAKIVIECDGDYWHRTDDPTIAKRDKKKTKYLQSRGYIVLRFWESEIKNDVQKCVDQISNLWRDYMK